MASPAIVLRTVEDCLYLSAGCCHNNRLHCSSGPWHCEHSRSWRQHPAATALLPRVHYHPRSAGSETQALQVDGKCYTVTRAVHKIPVAPAHSDTFTQLYMRMTMMTMRKPFCGHGVGEGGNNCKVMLLKMTDSSAFYAHN